MKKAFFAAFVTLLMAGCHGNTPNQTPDAELYLYAGNKVYEYYGFDTYRLDLTECDYSLPSILHLQFSEMRINEARADYLTGKLSRNEYRVNVKELLNGCTDVANAWKNDIPDTSDRRVMYKCEADSGIVFYIVLDKDNTTPVCSTMDIEKKYNEIVEMVKSLD